MRWDRMDSRRPAAGARAGSLPRRVHRGSSAFRKRETGVDRMNGGLTYRDMDLRKQKAKNLDEALEFLRGNMDSEKLMTVERILRRGIVESRPGGALLAPGVEV